MEPWRLSDALWPRWMLAAREHWVTGETAAAGTLWNEARALTETFGDGDPRRAASLHACALAEDNPRTVDDALIAWDHAAAWVDTMVIVDGARSSLFHQRLEARHRGVYPGIVRNRHRKTLAAGRAAAMASLAVLRDDRDTMRAALGLRRDAFGHRESEAAAMAGWLGEPVTDSLVDRFRSVPPHRDDDEARLYAAALLVPSLAWVHAQHS